MNKTDRNELEEKFNNGLSLLTTDLSELRAVLLLAKLRPIYEELHPETKHGGARTEQAAKMAAWPSFPKYVAQTGKWTERTAQRRFEQGARVQALGPEVIAACNGTILANKLGTLERFCDVPEDQRMPLVELFCSNYTEGLKRLKELEEPAAKEDVAPPEEDEDQAEPEFTRPTITPEPLKSSDATGQAEYRLRKVKEGHEAIVDLEGKKVRVLVAADLQHLVLAPLDQRSAPRSVKKAVAKKPRTPVYPNDAERPHRDLFKTLVRETLSEFSGHSDLKAFGGREDTHAVWTYVHHGKQKWMVTWWFAHPLDRKFLFESGSSWEGMPAGTAEGCPSTVAEMRSALRKFIKTYVAKPAPPTGTSKKEAS